MTATLASWNDCAARRAILDFVASVTNHGSSTFVPAEERIAIFDSDGTLWCEKPSPARLPETARHPTLDRLLCECGYVPMVELIAYLEANGFTNFIESGGGRDFMQAVVHQTYGIPPDRVIGSASAADEGDGPMKPVRIWNRIGRRPIMAAGNSNGDIQMLQFSGGPSKPVLRMLILHDDKVREFDYTVGAERSLELARRHGWTVVSMKNDWRLVFSAQPAASRASAEVA
jgi:hypothetical protein